LDITVGFYPDFADYRITQLNNSNGSTTYRVVDTKGGRDWRGDALHITTISDLKGGSNHATLVAGVMDGARNGEGAVGIAYDAKLSGHYIQGTG